MRIRTTLSLAALASAALTLPAAGQAPAPGQAAAPRAAAAELRDATGAAVGTVRFEERAAGAVALDVEVSGLAPGMHGIHLHAVGRCEAPAEGPAFGSAGGHFNPHARAHGLHNPEGAHGGDLPNLEVGEDGKGRLRTTTDRVTLGAGAASLFDADGTAVVIHAGPDDQQSDPAGNSGARVACGVVEAP